MRDLSSIPATKPDLDAYEVDHLFHSWAYQPKQSPARVVSAKGVRFMTEDGRERLDFSSCFVSHNIGHQDPRVVKAIKDQADTLTSFAPPFSNRPRALLAKLLEEVTPGDLSRAFLTVGGTEANEAAIKICHQFTGRRKIVSRYRSYHGGTATSMSASVGDPRSWAQVPGGAEIIRVPQPYPYRCMFGTTNPTDCAMRCVAYTDQVIEMEGGREKVAGIILEPIAGANGVIVPPPEYLPALRAVCDKHDILMIVDEVMTGFGRTGKWFAVDHWGVVPDILTMAKGMTCGYVPLGAAVVRKHIGDYFKDHFFSHGATYAGHALACATANAVIPIYQQDRLVENAATMGAYLVERAQTLAETHPSVGEVRGLGLFVGIELVRNRKTKEPLIPLDAKIRPGANPKTELAKRLFELGMICMAANPSNSIALAPPLIITKDEIDEGIAMLDEALQVTDAYAER
ncbi:MAG TPA: aminotransferase class III-fold pyridoxal phosphate-dependent enzyme [Candidatus Hydrogenedentes bacterium]|nr:aminotransferase class III-fold pyridoxal phosphate-dependent enzyme [Candidatus Hydrogenedentota bacterium]